MDRSIPFYNLILRCDRFQPSEIVLQQGYHFKPFEKGDEKAWAVLEYEIGDFGSRQEAESYFIDAYGGRAEEIRERCIFLANEREEIVGSCIAWRDRRGTERVASLHWLVVAPAYQGKGLGKALCQKVMRLFWEKREFPVYIHTQPWSFRAVLLYVGQGFRLQMTDTFSDYENQYFPAMEALQKILTKQQYDVLVSHSSR